MDRDDSKGARTKGTLASKLAEEILWKREVGINIPANGWMFVNDTC